MLAIRRWIMRLEEHVIVRGVIFGMLLVLIGGIIFFLNVHTPMMMDDYDYSFSLSTGDRIANPLDVLSSQVVHYKIWGGRSIVHAIAQLFLSANKAVFNVFNTLMYLLLLLEIYAIARSDARKANWTILLLSHVFLFFFVPFFGTVFLWLDGACNYLWGTVLALCPILLHRSSLSIGWFSSGKVRSTFAVIICFLAGWTNENTACGVFAVVFLMVVLAKYEGQRVAPWQWAALAAQLFGIAVMLLAPGNYVRASAQEQDSIVKEFLRRFAVVTVYAGVYGGGLAAVYILFLSLCRWLQIRVRLTYTLLLAFGALLTAYALVASPVVSDRSYTGAVILLLAALLSAAGDFEASVRHFDAQKLIVLPLILLVVVHGGYKAIQAVGAHEEAWHAQLTRIEEAKAQGESRVEIESVPSVSPYTFSIALEEEPTVWPNSTLSKYFDIEIFGKK